MNSDTYKHCLRFHLLNPQNWIRCYSNNGTTVFIKDFPIFFYMQCESALGGEKRVIKLVLFYLFLQSSCLAQSVVDAVDMTGGCDDGVSAACHIIKEIHQMAECTATHTAAS